MSERRIRVGEIELNYRLTGPEGAPVVSLNHCFSGDHRYWDHHLAAFEGFRILRHAARGHGKSDKPAGPYTLAMMADDLRGLLDQLAIERVHLCGVSMGGMISQTLAIVAPERVASLALVNTTCQYDAEQIKGWRDRAALVQREGVAPLHELLMTRWFTGDAATQRTPGYRYMEDCLHRFEPEAFAAVSAAISNLNTTTGLAALDMPRMVIATKDDPGVPTAMSELMARQLNVAPQWIGPAQHLASLEYPEIFNGLMRDFLSQFA